jgi:hypothetical protein
MHRLGTALFLACLLVPSVASAEEESAWWATPTAEAEIDNGWWHGGSEDVALEGAPEAPASVASVVGPVATQSLPSFAVAKTGPGCDADTGVCDENDSLELDGQREGDSGDTAEGSSLPAGDEPAEDEAAATGTNAAPTSNAAVQEDDEPPHNCERYSKQIYRYLDEREYAKQRGNERAVMGLEAQIKRLEAQMDRRCPLPPPPNKFAAMMRMLKDAAKLALMAAKYGLI